MESRPGRGPESRDVEALVDSWIAEGLGDEAEAERVDPEILAGFVVESLDALAEAEHAALSFESRPDDPETVNSIFRCFHTIKGTSSFLDLAHISTFAHEAESLLGRLRDGTVTATPEVVDLVIRSIDALGQWIRAAEHHPHEVPAGMDLLIESLNAGRTATGDGMAEARTPGMHAGMGPAGEAWTRVRTDRLDRLLEAIGELLVTQAILEREAGIERDSDSSMAQAIRNNNKTVRLLRDLGMSMRMVPLRPEFQKLSRLVRDLSRKSGKPIEFVVEGEDVELDRNMVEVLNEPLVHMIRNSVDHGVETPEERVRAGKSELARVSITAVHAGGNVVIELADDGRGLDTEKICAKGIAHGLLRADRPVGEDEVHELIFAPAFSTADRVTDLSGRGVGMDVVRRNLEALNGHIEVHSTRGVGCRFRMVLPVTLAITEGMLVRVGSDRYLLPVINIQRSFRPSSSALRTVAGRAEMVALSDGLVPMVRLHRMFGIGDAVEQPERALLVVAAAAERRCALLVDELLGQQQVVTRNLNGFGRVPGVSGAAILGDGQVALILDIAEINGLARSARGHDG